MLAFSSERHVYKDGSLRAGSMAVHSVVLMFETLTLHLKKIFLHIFFLPANADLQIMDYKYVYFFCMTWQVLYPTTPLHLSNWGRTTWCFTRASSPKACITNNVRLVFSDWITSTLAWTATLIHPIWIFNAFIVSEMFSCAEILDSASHQSASGLVCCNTVRMNMCPLKMLKYHLASQWWRVDLIFVLFTWPCFPPEAGHCPCPPSHPSVAPGKKKLGPTCRRVYGKGRETIHLYPFSLSLTP